MIRQRIQLVGVVQGVGFRPFVRNLACDCQLTGWVFNHSAGVTIEVQGLPDQVARFLDRLAKEQPSLARIDRCEVTSIEPIDEPRFIILPSPVEAGRSTPISPDIAMCTDCRNEFNDPENRRYHYPFINCTNCGPRFTIVQSVPYDRPRTTMKTFPMCRECQREYDRPANRRYHAQPNACPQCGPTIWFVVNPADELAFLSRPNTDDASNLTQRTIEQFQQTIAAGKIVAVKGIGGFHLACDATQQAAVEHLRQRKGRVDKPFAVMVRDLNQARHIAHVGRQEQALLESPQRPIVLLRKRANRPTNRDPEQNASADPTALQSIGPHVAPGNDFLGVMLPYSPLHELLVRDRPLVMTSGNRSDEPIARTNGEARERLGELADAFLVHDRPIEIVCDDSIVRHVDANWLPIRRSRGYAPLPIRLPTPGPSVLAVGGEIKSTFCLTRDDYAFMSQHIGDMGNLETLDALQRSVDHFRRLFQVDPQAIVADLHPGYLSGQWAERLAESLRVPLIRVQHHWAHVVSLATEHGQVFDSTNTSRFIGCCFDGTGYGTDGTIWGGEFLTWQEPKMDTPREGGENPAPPKPDARQNHTANFCRLAHLTPFPLPGGDACVRRPWRTALALLWKHQIDWNPRLPAVAACPENQRRPFAQQLDRNLNCTVTSSMGRLFDAVASLIGIRHSITYEAQAAMEMEALASEHFPSLGHEPNERTSAPHADCEWPLKDRIGNGAYGFALHFGRPIEIDPSPLIKAICLDVLNGVNRSVIAAQFHRSVAEMIVNVCQAIRHQTGLDRVGLTGGVFQNALLLRLASAQLTQADFHVLLHQQVPPNDAGIALGQAIFGREASDSRR